MIVRVRGVDINAETHEVPGVERPTLVLIHGFGASLRTWDRLTPALGASHSWISLDLKGFGLSDHPRDGDYSIDENAELVCGLLQTLKLERVVLIGHSYGGAVAISVADRLRDRRPSARVAGLVLIDSASYRQRLPYFVEVSRHTLTRWLGALTPIDWGTRVVLRSLFADPSLVDADMVERYAFHRRIAGAAYSEAQTAQQILPRSFEAVTRAIGSIDVPTQIIWGDRDRAVPLAFAERLHADIRQSRVDVVPNAGHLPHEERPAEVIRILLSFLGGLA